MNGRSPNIADAIRSLAPDAEWSIEDESLDKLIWHTQPKNIPSNAEIEKELDRLIFEFNNKDAQDEALRISALNKLKKFGLTEAEAKTVIGI